MAVRTFTTAGVNLLWSNAANWDTGVPGDGDSAIIPALQTCEFDVDQSAFPNGLAGLTITGELQASTTAGAYYLKMKANVTGVGVLRAGTVGTQYPVGCTFTMYMNGAYHLALTGDGSFQLYAATPVYKYVTQTALEPIGETVIAVDTDVTGDIWAAGDTVRIDEVTIVKYEEYTIAAGGIATGTITLTSGLTAAKSAGALVFLTRRNVRLLGTYGTSARLTSGGTNGYLRCEFRDTNSVISAASGTTIDGVMVRCSYGVNSCLSSNVTAIILSGFVAMYYCYSCNFSGRVSGCTSVMNECTNCIFSGVASGVSYCIEQCTNCVLSGTALNCTRVISFSMGTLVIAPVVTGAATFAYYTIDFTAYNTVLPGIEYNGYNTSYRAAYNYTESINHDNVADAYRAWCRGGIVNSVVTPVPTGHTIAYQHACESASYPVFRRQSVTVQAGGVLTVQAHLRKDADMAAYLPCIQIIDQFADPLVSASYTALAETAMTNSIDAWEDITITWTNTGTTARAVWIRSLAMSAANNFYCEWTYSFAGGVSRARIIGGV